MRDRTTYTVLSGGLQHIRVVEAGQSHADAWAYIMSLPVDAHPFDHWPTR